MSENCAVNDCQKALLEAEIRQLEADKAAISETASYYLHKVERLKAVINHRRRPKS